MDIQCPNCKQKYPFEESLIGNEVECAVCHTVFVAQKRAPIKLTADPLSMVQQEHQTNQPIPNGKQEDRTNSCSAPFCDRKGDKKSATKRVVCFGGVIVGIVVIGVITLLLCLNWNLVLATLGNSNAQYRLGESYYQSDKYVEAVKWFRKAAEQGHADAQYKLGVCYNTNLGVTRDFSKAAKWYHKAAEQGHADAQYLLSVCYELGNGVTEDLAEGVKWCRKAAEQGHADAQYHLGVCYYNGYGVTKDYYEATKWYRKAAEQGVVDAQMKLGTYYLFDNKNEAKKWFLKASEQLSCVE
jgi:TPR repeat protein